MATGKRFGKLELHRLLFRPRICLEPRSFHIPKNTVIEKLTPVSDFSTDNLLTTPTKRVKTFAQTAKIVTKNVGGEHLRRFTTSPTRVNTNRERNIRDLSWHHKFKKKKPTKITRGRLLHNLWALEWSEAAKQRGKMQTNFFAKSKKRLKDAQTVIMICNIWPKLRH